MIHSLRANLCLLGFSWVLAHVLATDVVMRALDQIGARRPSWIEGQREFTSLGYTMRVDVNCWQCGDQLPMFRKKYCSDECCRVWNRHFASH
jgi:hypothetical protein